MLAAADLYVEGQSWLHRLDPRVKLLGAGLGLILLLALNNLLLLGAGLLLVLLLHASARVPAARLGRVLRTLLPVSLLIFSLRVLFQPVGAALWAWWIVRITPLALAEGGVLVLRILTMAFVIFLWLYTTDSATVTASLTALGLPDTWSLTLALALRFMPAFQATYQRIADAQQARGLDLRGSHALARVRRMMPILVTLIITSLRASEQLATALEARAFGAPGVVRSARRTFQLRSLDWLVLAVVLAGAAGLLTLRATLGFGAAALGLFP